MPQSPHIPVLLSQTIASFEGIDEGFFIDCTLGYAGHSQALLEHFPKAKLIGIDRDQTAIDFATRRLAPFTERFEAIRADFASGFARAVARAGVLNVKGVLADIGVSSLQLDKLERGFGFESDVLDMRMDQDAALDAYEVVNNYSQSELERILREYGELPHARKLAADIVQARPIESAKALASLAMRYRGGKKIHPATLLFQAIRIEVNDELGQLTSVLDAIEAANFVDTIVSIITFHSLEDRIVKQRFRAWAQSCICDAQAMRCTCGNNHALGVELHRKPQSADSSELASNPRSRSAKLRSFRFGARETF
ncbi:MAG: 16S rRNA methyltransferase [Sulfurovum sp. PC08-66]|nr:MAG: 16S rRNA methyltransferase [Sulfurovum sp. PC08-66]KIM12379.1 MAG: 16S rRNA methyltransferase [Sulfuricurvum sp. PC08-66]